MALGQRFIGVPRPVLAARVADLPGWRAMGFRILERSKALCPVGESEERSGPHLRDQLMVRFITGADPRQLIGARTEVLRYVHDGTEPHEIRPRAARALRFTSRDGSVVFAASVQHPGTQPNRFILEAIATVVRSR